MQNASGENISQAVRTESENLLNDGTIFELRKKHKTYVKLVRRQMRYRIWRIVRSIAWKTFEAIHAQGGKVV